MKKMICLLLAVLMIATVNIPARAASSNIGLEPGQEVPDFTVSLTDGTTAALSELLEGKELVVLNIFATWCAPCELEFPGMEKVYQANSDRMVILSVSGDPGDTMEMVADYKEAHALTFPMGVAGDALNFINLSAYPTTIFITRGDTAGSGKVSFIKVGAFIDEGAFEEKVNTFLSADYDGAALPTEMAKSSLPKVLAMIVGAMVLLVIGRWRLFVSAGVPGWYSLIPILSTYKEYAISWVGSLGIVSILCQVGSGAVLLLSSHANWTILCSAGLMIMYLVIRLVESVKLSKAFGRGILIGILIGIFHSPGRFVLSLIKSEYCGPAAKS